MHGTIHDLFLPRPLILASSHSRKVSCFDAIISKFHHNFSQNNNWTSPFPMLELRNVVNRSPNGPTQNIYSDSLMHCCPMHSNCLFVLCNPMHSHNHYDLLVTQKAVHNYPYSRVLQYSQTSTTPTQVMFHCAIEPIH